MPRVRYNEKTVPLTVRVPKSVYDPVAKLARARAEESGLDPQQANVTQVVIEALSAHTGLLKGGAFFPTEQEAGLLETLRKLLRSNAGCVEAIQVLAYQAAESPDIASAIVKLSDVVEDLRYRSAKKGRTREG